jgi:SagB-type dehydrogenase family enzyme
MSSFVDPDIAALYHLHSSNVRSRSIDMNVDHDAVPARFQSRPGSPRVALGGRDFQLDVPLGRAIELRRSRREFVASPLDPEILGRLLHMSYGLRGRKVVDGTWSYDRSVPSAGGLYPLELYLALQAVSGIADGLYHYDPLAHELEQLEPGHFQAALASLSIGQDMILSANATIVISAVRRRTMWKYGQRGYRFLWLDAGHVGQNVYLVATGMGLGVAAVGGFFDGEVDALLRLSADEQAMYMLCVGNCQD